MGKINQCKNSGENKFTSAPMVVVRIQSVHQVEGKGSASRPPNMRKVSPTGRRRDPSLVRHGSVVSVKAGQEESLPA